MRGSELLREVEFGSMTSTATMSAAPAIRAPWIALIPTPPPPKTATEEPGWIFAVFSAAPAPVMTPQPISAATSKGTSFGILIGASARTTASSAKVPVPAKPKAAADVVKWGSIKAGWMNASHR